MYRRAGQIKVVDRIDYLAVAVSAADIESLYTGDLGSLMLESVDVEDIESAYLADLEYVPDMMLEAIKAKASKLNQRMKAFSRALGQQLSPINMNAGDVEISKPRKSGAVAVQVAKIPLSDGQSVSLVFHAPDNDPLKVEADDTLIAFRFLVNSRDVTHIVAPSGGRDISLKQTALALANVVEKNAPKFFQAQAKKTEQAAELEQVKKQIDAAEADISNLGVEHETYQELKQSREKKARTLQSQIDNQNEIQAELRKQIEVKQAAKENAEGNEDKLKALFGTPKLKAASDVVMSDGHARVFQNLAIISDIDINGQSFDERGTYVSSIVGRVKRLSKNGEQDKVDNILTMINEYNKVADKPAITLRNGIWKLGDPKSISVSEEPQPESPDPVSEPELAPSAVNSAAEMVRTVLSELESGAIALKQAKDHIRTNSEIPESLQGMVKSTIATMRKPRFLEEGKLLLKALEQHDDNAPVVNVDGITYNLNDFTYNIMDELGRFGDNLTSIARDYPNKAIDYLDSDLDGLSQATIDSLKKAINEHYVAGGESVELNVDDLTDEEKAQLSFIQTFIDFKLALGEQEVTFPSGESKTYNIEEPEDSAWQVDEVYGDLKDDLNLFGKIQLEPIAEQENNNYYNQEGQQVGIRTWHIKSDYTKDSNGAYSNSYLSAGTQGSEHHSYKVTPVTRDGKFTFAVVGDDGEIGLIDNFSELESLLVERHGLTAERPEQPVEPTQEEKHVEKLQEIRDYTDKPSLEKADEYQAAIESAYAFFEELSVLEEHNDLLEAAFANHVKLQSELTV